MVLVERGNVRNIPHVNNNNNNNQNIVNGRMGNRDVNWPQGTVILFGSICGYLFAGRLAEQYLSNIIPYEGDDLAEDMLRIVARGLLSGCAQIIGTRVGRNFGETVVRVLGRDLGDG